MGKKKVVSYFCNRYKGDYLEETTCRKLENLLRIDKEKGYIEDLKHCIFNLSPSDVDLIRDTKSNTCAELAKGELENIQTIGVAYMYYAKNLILGDSVGLGKTVEICALCNLLQAEYEKKGLDFKFLYLTEKNILPQAQNEFIKFTGEYVDILFGEKKYVTKFVNSYSSNIDYSVVGSHSLLTNEIFQEFLIQYYRDHGAYPFDLLIVDEAGDILINSTTKTYKSAMQIRNMFERVVLLNATPFEKSLDMFYNQINFVDSTLLPTKTSFNKEYKIMSYYGPYPQFSGKYKNAEQFRHLVGYRYLARTRKSAGATMTNCTADVIVSPLSKEQKSLLKVTSMPSMVYDCPSYFGTGIPTDEVSTPKIASLLELLNGPLKNEKSILIYSRYKESQACLQDILNDYCIDSCILNGDSSQEERECVINSFKLGDIRVLITNVQKGLNFGNCNTCIFYSYDPNPNKMVQFEGRMTRSYNIDNKHVYLLLSRGKELNTFKKTVADRAKASDIFAGSDFSCVLSILLENDKLANIK